MKQLRHTSKTSETLKTYICNIGEGKGGPVDSSHQGRSRGVAQCVSITSTARARGYPWLGRERSEAPQHMHPNGHGGVSNYGVGRRTNDKGESDIGVWDGARHGVVGHGAAADERAVEEVARTNDRPRYCVGRRADKDE